MKKREVRHVPVLLPEVLRVLNPRAGQVIVDCTLGLGGHAVEILKRVGTTGRVIGIDFDPANLALAEEKLRKVSRNFSVHHTNFAGIAGVLAAEGIARVDGVLADVGVASTQIDDPQRGFSYKKPGPLDMRMDPTRGKSAAEWIAKMTERDMAAAFLELGDETDAAKIARLIVKHRAEEPIATTQRLMAIICEARDFTLVRAAGAKLHPAARTFQALRILVNRELANLENLVRVLPTCLKPRGIAAIICFHSGEDRRVKQAFRAGHRAGIYSEVSDEPIIATETAIAENPRARSAKLRWARRAG